MRKAHGTLLPIHPCAKHTILKPDSRGNTRCALRKNAVYLLTLQFAAEQVRKALKIKFFTPANFTAENFFT
jgi:hypothetical protein